MRRAHTHTHTHRRPTSQYLLLSLSDDEGNNLKRPLTTNNKHRLVFTRVDMATGAYAFIFGVHAQKMDTFIVCNIF